MLRSRRDALAVGPASALLGVLGYAVAGAITVALTEPLVSDPLALPAFGTPLEVVASLGLGLVVGAPLVAAVGACYAVGTGRAALRPVAAGVVLGGLVHGAGVAVVSAAAFMPWIEPSLAARQALVVAAFFAGVGAVGALAGDLLRQWGRSPADPSGALP
jgi:hypothetical protein